jgi:hypothetical protein
LAGIIPPFQLYPQCNENAMVSMYATQTIEQKSDVKDGMQTVKRKVKEQ